MIERDDLLYFTDRYQQEMRRAISARERSVRTAHLQLAELHRKRARELLCNLIRKLDAEREEMKAA